MDLLNNKGYAIFIIGIMLDMFTTITGQFLGFPELGVGGFVGVYIANFLILGIVGVIMHYKNDQLANNKYVQITLASIGIFRIVIAFMNVYTVSLFGG